MLRGELLSPRSVHDHPTSGSTLLLLPLAAPAQPLPSISLCLSQTSYFAQDSHHDSGNISMLHPQFSVLEELNRTQRLHQLSQSCDLTTSNYHQDFGSISVTSPSPPTWKGRSQLRVANALMEDDTMLSPIGLSGPLTSLAPLLPSIHPIRNSLMCGSNPSSQPVSTRSSPYHFLLSPPPGAQFMSPPPGVLLSSSILSSDSLSAQSFSKKSRSISNSVPSASYQSLTPLSSKPPSRQMSSDHSMEILTASDAPHTQSLFHPHSQLFHEIEAVQQQLARNPHQFPNAISQVCKTTNASNDSPPSVVFDVGLIPQLLPITRIASSANDRRVGNNKVEAAIVSPSHQMLSYEADNNQHAVLTAQVIRAAALATAAGCDEIDLLEFPQLSSVTSSLQTTPTTSALHSRSNSPHPDSSGSTNHSVYSSFVTSTQEHLPSSRHAGASLANIAAVRPSYTKVCPYAGCNARFPKESTLQRHIRCHTGEKPFKCVVDGCEAAFSEKGNLLRHEASAHRNERQFTCPFPYCLTEFRRAAHVEQHVQTQHVSRGEDVSRAYSYLKPPEKSRKRSKVAVSLSSSTLRTKVTVPISAAGFTHDVRANSAVSLAADSDSQSFKPASATHADSANVSVSASSDVIRSRQLHSSSASASSAVTSRTNNCTTRSMYERSASSMPLSPISPMKKKQRGSKSI